MTATAGHLFEGADWDFTKLQHIHDACERRRGKDASAICLAIAAQQAQPLPQGCHGSEAHTQELCDPALSNRVGSERDQSSDDKYPRGYLASAQAQAMIYVRNGAFVEDIHGLKLLRNSAEVWRWLKGVDLGLEAKGK
jgi:hypothetical protein